MILPMFGFVAMLIVVGGLATLVAVGDPHHARLVPYIGFVFLFAGLGALLLSLALTLLEETIFHSDVLSVIGLFGGYAFGGLGGAALGFFYATKRLQRIELEASNKGLG